MKDRTIIYSVIFWLGLGIIAVWIVLKLVGIFESPIWQEMLPYSGGIFIFGAFYQMILDLKKDFGVMKKRQDRMASGLIRIESDLGHLRRDFDRHLAKH